MFRYLTLALVAGFFFAFPANAGGNNHNSQARAKAVAAALATGGAGGSVDSLSLSIPGAASPHVSNVHKCAVSNSWAIPIYSQSKTTLGEFCMLVWQRDEACYAVGFVRNVAEVDKTAMPLLKRAADSCLTLNMEVAEFRKRMADGPPVKLSAADDCKPDEHGVIPAFCPGGMFGQ